MSAAPPDDSVQFVRGVGPFRAKEFDRLGVQTVSDLVEYLPFRYDIIPKSVAIGRLKLDEVATIVGEVRSVRQSGNPHNPIIKANVVDGTGMVRIRWFNSSYLTERLHPGATVRLTGKVGVHIDNAEMTNPVVTILDREIVDTEEDRERLIPVYSATANLPTTKIAQTIGHVLDSALPRLDDFIPQTVRTRRALVDRRVAIRTMHRPASLEQVQAARRTLAFEELFLHQMAVQIARAAQQSGPPALPIHVDNRLDERIRRRFPFELSTNQNKAIDEIRRDLARTQSMNRLLQGDVGAGKTAVALYAALATIANKQQVVFVAPTEVLARQHEQKTHGYLEGSRVTAGFLSGSTPPRRREKLLADLQAGAVDLLIGTHAVLEPGVAFANLGLIIVDEQQKFGVAQRAALRQKGIAPHCLILSATPIPRTLAMTLFGELDVSTIHGMLPGRSAVRTRLVTPRDDDAAWAFIRTRLDDGEQAYIVYPLVEESENVSSQAATVEARRLADTHLKDYRIELLHGRMSSADKLAAMGRFQSGDAQVLVSTTVIEVGVDVAGATVMAIQNAERFGLSQLHQLRGRVGRGSLASYCLLFTQSKADAATQRLKILTATNDGFRIAEEDLRLRGPGELLGTRQHGMPTFKVADLTEDLELLTQARDDATEILSTDSRLTAPKHSALRRALAQRYADRISLIDVA